MAEEIKDLIEKINQEGIQAAENKAREIEEQAKRQAKELIEKARQEAQKIAAETKDKCAKAEESTKTLLKQAGRDLLLSLRKEINAILDKIIIANVSQALRQEEMARIIGLLVKDYTQKQKEGLIISLNKEDLQRLEQGLWLELGQEIKKGITLKPSEDIQAGFTISYDNGKSQFDFTDKSFADYIGLELKPKLAELLKDAAL